MPGDVSVVENAWNDEYKRVKKVKDRLLEEGNKYKMKKDKLEEALLEKEVARIAMTRSIVNSERTVNHL